MILHNILFRQRMLMTTQYTMEGPVYSSTRIVQMTGQYRYVRLDASRDTEFPWDTVSSVTVGSTR